MTEEPKRRQSDYDPEVLSRAEIREIFRDEGEKIVRNTFDLLGVDITDGKQRNDLRDDFRWVRDVRSSSAAMGRHARNVGIGALVLAALTSLWAGFKVKVGG